MSSEWTTNDISNLKGKVIIVTGGNSGIGFEAVKMYAAKGAKVVMASRSLLRANEAIAKICKELKDAQITAMELDLSSLQSVEAFADAFKKKFERLDILMNNAGIMMTPYGKTKDGFEQQLGVNHIGHFALTAQLFDVIKATPKSRIVNISSNAHKFGKVRFENMTFEDKKGYNRVKAYAQSKIANLLFTYELQRKVDAAGLHIKVLAAHPGAAITNLGRHMEEKLLFKVFGKLFTKILQSAYSGTLPGVRASLDSDALGGTYYGPNGRYGMKGKPVVVKSSAASHSEADAKKLWEITERLCGVSFDFGK